MKSRFTDKKLERLYTEEKGAKKFPKAVVENFFHVMGVIDAATSTQDLRALKGLRFEQLKGARAGQSSLRLNDQYRLIVKIETSDDGEEVVVVEIADYH